MYVLDCLPVKLKYTKQMSFSVENCVIETQLFCLVHSKMIVFLKLSIVS